jgi:hypothetical protein
VPINTKVVSSNHASGEVYSIQHSSVTCARSEGLGYKLIFHNINRKMMKPNEYIKKIKSCIINSKCKTAVSLVKITYVEQKKIYDLLYP